MDFLKVLLAVIAGYLLGSLSFSIMLSKGFLGGDVRGKGSGNAGATNMARVYGMLAGVATLLGDAVKAAVAMLIGHLLMADVGLALAGMSCLLGHCFPVFHGFKGGKGVSVGAAVGFAIDWRVGLLVLLSFLVVALISKKVSLGSICGALAITVGSLIFAVSLPKLLLAVGGMILVIARHKENIGRLIKGTEPNFKPGSRKKQAENK